MDKTTGAARVAQANRLLAELGGIDILDALEELKVRRAADAAVPPPCDDKIFHQGQVVAVLDGGAKAVEGVVAEANRRLSLAGRVDWHYVGGRAVVKTVGDVEQARKALEQSIPRQIG
jgi:hypothetical protein